MKPLLLSLVFLISISAQICGQTSYTYDNSGNRVGRTIIMPSNTMAAAPDSTSFTDITEDQTSEFKDQAGSFEFSIYPNPTKGEVHIKSATEAEGVIMLYDMQGKIIYQYRGKLGDNRVDLYRQKSGLYVLSISSDGQEVKWKIIKE